jgi:hypothetical protein
MILSPYTPYSLCICAFKARNSSTVWTGIVHQPPPTTKNDDDDDDDEVEVAGEEEAKQLNSHCHVSVSCLVACSCVQCNDWPLSNWRGCRTNHANMQRL